MQKQLMMLLILVFTILCLVSASFAATDEEIKNSTTNGTEWLAEQQNADGSWGTNDRIGSTEFAVLKLETHATESGKSPFDPTYQYSDEVQKGLDYLFLQAKEIDLTVQPAGNPDSNGDGKGIYFGSSTYDYKVMYQTGLALTAITAGGDPNRVVNVPGSVVNGKTYKEVAQNIADFIAWAQNDAGTGRGGWYYVPNQQTGDNSVSGYVVLGLVYATSPANGYDCNVPAFVKTELNTWADYIQSDATGGSGYNSPDDYYANVYNTGNLLVEFAFLGDESTSPRVTAAINFLVNNWNQPGSGYNDVGWKESSPEAITNYIACYSIMKALESFNLDTIGGIDWYQDFANAIIAEQNADGSWPMSKWATNNVLSTCWALVTLEKAAAPIKAADIELTKTVDNTKPLVGNTIQYLLTINNKGPDPANNITITELLSSNLQFVSAIPSKGTYDPKTGIWTIGTLENGESATLTINAIVKTAGSIINQANATALEFDPDLSNNQVSQTVEALPQTIDDLPEPETNVNAASNTLRMLETGTPISYLIIAILMVFSGIFGAKRK